MKISDLKGVITGMGNFGAAGVFASALYVLHVNSIDAFRAELAEERKLSRESSAAERKMCHESFEEISKACGSVHSRLTDVHHDVLKIKERLK